MQLTILDTVNDPGTPGKTGDDRVGFDASAGTAWVLDGATDVTDLRPFNRAESGAAWIAQALSDRLIIAPHEGETVEAYFEHVLTDVRQRATKETRCRSTACPARRCPSHPASGCALRATQPRSPGWVTVWASTRGLVWSL
tara:strand:+ start:2562 stop:2984 length:423 start_codon:yes stop_codon:yes gene_type:complete